MRWLWWCSSSGCGSHSADAALGWSTGLGLAFGWMCSTCQKLNRHYASRKASSRPRSHLRYETEGLLERQFTNFYTISIPCFRAYLYLDAMFPGREWCKCIGPSALWQRAESAVSPLARTRLSWGRVGRGGKPPVFQRGGNPSCVLDQQQSSKNAAAPSAMPYAGRTTRCVHRAAPSCRRWTIPISFRARVRPERRVLPVLPKRPALPGHLRLPGHPNLRELPRHLAAQGHQNPRANKEVWRFASQ